MNISKKVITIDIPKEYIIDHSRSNDRQIVAYLPESPIIEYDEETDCIHISYANEDFLLSTSLDYIGTIDEAKAHIRKKPYWKLPTVRQCQVIYIWFNQINSLIKKTKGCILSNDARYWTRDKESTWLYFYYRFDCKTGDYISKTNTYRIRLVHDLK